jgi:putative ATPase
VHFLGVPEGDQALAQVAIYLAIAPKSDAAYQALNKARALVQATPAEPVPMQLRNAPTRAMKEWGYGQGYQHAHQLADAITQMECFPYALAGTRFYEPTHRGTEARIAERLAEIRRRRAGEPPAAGSEAKADPGAYYSGVKPAEGGPSTPSSSAPEKSEETNQ